MNAREWLRTRREAKAGPKAWVIAPDPATVERRAQMEEAVRRLGEALRASTPSASELRAAWESQRPCNCHVIYSRCYCGRNGL